MKWEPRIRAVVASVLCIGLAACGGSEGGGSAGQAPSPGLVSYADPVAAGTIANYTDADWLFANYLGSYGVPDALKPAFLPAMKLLANGFMLQLKTGQDVRANIEQVHALFLQYAASGDAAQFVAQVQGDFKRQGAVVSTSSQAPVPADPPDLPQLSPQDQADIEAARRRDQQEQRTIQEMAQRHDLPYRIEETPEQWFIYYPSMKSGHKVRPGGGTTSGAHSSVTQWGLRRGDVLWVNGTGSIPGVPGHNAIVFGNGTEVYFIDANTDVGVALHTEVQRWVERYSEVRALTPRLRWDLGEFQCYQNYGSAYGCAADSFQRIHAWWYAWDRQGAAYNWNFTNPRATDRFYCSSLVWNAYNSVNYNIIAPWVLGSFGMITPNQIRDSQALVPIKVSVK